jgi:hypothetical protein
MEGRYVVVMTVLLLATLLYVAGLVTNVSATTPVEPQSVFTLYGAILGYLFGSHEKKHDQETELSKKGSEQPK